MFAQDTANEKENQKKDQVSPLTTVPEYDEDSEGSYTTITEVVENQQAIEEDVEDNQEAINDNQDVVIEDARVIVEKVFLMEAEQPTIEDDQNIIGEDVEAEKE